MSGVEQHEGDSIAQISFTLPKDKEWAEHLERLLEAVEFCLPEVKLLEWLPRHKASIAIMPSERLKLLRSVQKTKLQHFNVSDVGFTRSFSFNQYLTVGGSTPTVGNAPHHALLLTGSLLASNFNEKLVVDLGRRARPFTATFTPWDSGQLLNVHMGIAGSYERDSVQSMRLGAKLPRMTYSAESPFMAQQQPSDLGWINYWSPATREFMDFPEDFKGDAMFRYSYEGPEGSVIFKLTEEPLDLTRDDHIACYANALKRFPRFACLAPSR